MINSYTNTKKRLLPLVILFTAVVVGLVIILVVNGSRQKASTVVISNLSSCTKGINSAVQSNIETDLYGLVKSANDYNKKSSSSKYKATIREGSCKQTSENSASGYSGKRQTVKTTSITLDIPAAKQSWSIRFDWVTDKKIDTDLGSVSSDCLPKDRLVYGDFNCEKIVSLAKYGTDKPDPILQYMPYTGQGFYLEYNPETKAIKAQIQVRQKDANNQELIGNIKYSISYWFQKRNLDPANYTITYEVVVL